MRHPLHRIFLSLSLCLCLYLCSSAILLDALVPTTLATDAFQARYSNRSHHATPLLPHAKVQRRISYKARVPDFDEACRKARAYYTRSDPSRIRVCTGPNYWAGVCYRRRVSARRPAGLVLVDGMRCDIDEACVTYNPKTLQVVDVAALPKGVYVTVACVKADDEQHHYGPGKPDPGDIWVALPVKIPLQATWVTAKLAVLGDTSDAAYDLSFYYGKVGRIDRLAATKSIGSGNDTQTADGTVHMLDIGLPPPWQDVPQDLNFQAKVEFHTKHENALLMTTSYSFGSFLPPT